jgi:hypothetical protein
MMVGLDVWMSEIRLRAVIRIGEISRQLEKIEMHLEFAPPKIWPVSRYVYNYPRARQPVIC